MMSYFRQRIAGRWSILRFDQLMPNGGTSQFGQGRNAKLSHHVGATRFGGPDAEPESVYNFFVAFAFGQQFNDGAFARRQRLS
jgi:hypothetical protein